MPENHEQLWQEINRIRERVHALSSEIAKCQNNALAIQEIWKEMKDHRDRDSSEHKKIAVLEIQNNNQEGRMKTLEAIERGRTAKMVGIVAGVVATVVGIMEFLFRVLGRHS